LWFDIVNKGTENEPESTRLIEFINSNLHEVTQAALTLGKVIHADKQETLNAGSGGMSVHEPNASAVMEDETAVGLIKNTKRYRRSFCLTGGVNIGEAVTLIATALGWSLSSSLNVPHEVLEEDLASRQSRESGDPEDYDIEGYIQ
jgi:hypothetical protein